MKVFEPCFACGQDLYAPNADCLIRHDTTGHDAITALLTSPRTEPTMADERQQWESPVVPGVDIAAIGRDAQSNYSGWMRVKPDDMLAILHHFGVTTATLGREAAAREAAEAERDALIYFMVDGLGYSGRMVGEQMAHIASLDIDLAARARTALAATQPAATSEGGK